MSEIGAAEIGFESVLFELRCGINALNAIHATMSEGPDDPENYVDALYCVHGYLIERERSLESIYEGYRAAKAEVRKGGGGMSCDKIMAGGNLDNIVGLLIHCRAVLDTIQMAMGDNSLADAAAGVCNLLDGIIRDFRADIDGAEDYTGKGTEA